MSRTEDDAIEALLAQHTERPALALTDADAMLIASAMATAARALEQINFKKHGFPLFREAHAARETLARARAALGQCRGETTGRAASPARDRTR